MKATVNKQSESQREESFPAWYDGDKKFHYVVGLTKTYNRFKVLLSVRKDNGDVIHYDDMNVAKELLKRCPYGFSITLTND